MSTLRSCGAIGRWRGARGECECPRLLLPQPGGFEGLSARAGARLSPEARNLRGYLPKKRAFCEVIGYSLELTL
jgi:hypothetical protein